MLLNRNAYRAIVKSGVGILLTALLLAVVVIIPTSSVAGPASQSQENMDRLKMLSGQDFEIEFLSMMIEHHKSAVDMAKLVPDRAQRQEVKDIAQKITTDQMREIDQMTAWLQQWYSATPKQGMGEMSGMGMSDMMSLQNLKGDAFDKQFLTMMRTHHMSAIDMANLVPDRATHSELKTLAQNIISSQTAEVQQFEGWLQAWYNVSSTGAMSPGMSPEMSPGAMEGEMPRAGSGGVDWMILLAIVAALAVAITVAGFWTRKRA